MARPQLPPWPWGWLTVCYIIIIIICIIFRTVCACACPASNRASLPGAGAAGVPPGRVGIACAGGGRSPLLTWRHCWFRCCRAKALGRPIRLWPWWWRRFRGRSLQKKSPSSLWHPRWAQRGALRGPRALRESPAPLGDPSRAGGIPLLHWGGTIARGKCCGCRCSDVKI